MSFQMSVLNLTSFLMAACAVLWISSVIAAPLPLSYASNPGVLVEAAMPNRAPIEETEIDAGIAPDLQRQVVNYSTKVVAGTVATPV